MEEEKKKKIDWDSVSVFSMIAITAGSLVFLTAVGVKQENDPKYKYENYAKVEYNGESYNINDLYLLSSDTEKHVCILEDRSHMAGGFGITHKGDLTWSYRNVDDADVYIDIKSNDIIAVEDMEELFGYEVEKVAPYFPYEEYGTDGNLVIPQDKIEEITIIDDNNKTL